jgi:type I restriction-modification system DNA methylase subunit
VVKEALALIRSADIFSLFVPLAPSQEYCIFSSKNPSAPLVKVLRMAQNRAEARAEIQKLVHYFADNIYQLKAPSFNEAQVRQQLIDPFFEALGWDVRNRQMLPPYRLEVIPEGRIRSSLGTGVREQTQLFDKQAGVKEEMAEYASMLEYIAEDEYKAEQKVASKKPDYRFRLQGSTKFFVEAKKPSIDLINNPDAIFQIKRYGFSARVPVSILTDFEEFRVFDCTRKPFYDKPKVGVLKEFDLTYTAYLDEFDKLYATFSREAVVAGSIEALQTKYLQKRTGEFTLDRSFLEDLSEWRVELAQDIAKHPQNRRILNTYTLNECVQRILDRIVFLRVCEDRDIEEVGTLVALLRLWQDHPGLSLYEKFNELIKQRRSLYNGLLFTEHECERLVVSDKILEKIFKNINYPLSPYHFDEIGVEILGSIYERFLGRTIRLTKKQVRVKEKPEVRKAGGVYYTPQYIVNYIVENTLGRLLYGEPPVLARSPERTRGTTKQSDLPGKNQIASVATLPRNDTRRLLLTPKQVSKLKIIDIACGSGSFLLGAFQKLIDYHIEWYTQHPEDIKEVHGVRDVYEDNQGELRLSSRKKREILINNIYGVDIDPQAVEVTQMSLYLKVLEDENDATLNKPTMLALHEVLLPPLKNNIKCGNSLIGTDFYAQGELFDEDTRRKVNAFDWEMEFPEIMRAGGFDVAIGNPPWGSLLSNLERDYLTQRFMNRKGEAESHLFFIERGFKILRPTGVLGYITPNTWLSVLHSREIRKYLLESANFTEITELSKYIFDDAPDIVPILVFLTPNKHGESGCVVRRPTVTKVDAGNFGRVFAVESISQKFWRQSQDALINLRLNKTVLEIASKCRQRATNLSELCRVLYGIKTGDNTKYLSPRRTSRHTVKTLKTGELHRYNLIWRGYYLWWTPDLAGYREASVEIQKVVVQYIRKLSLSRRIIAALDEDGQYYPLNNYSYIEPPSRDYSVKYILGVLNSNLMNYYFANTFIDYNIKPTYLQQLPIHTIDFMNPAEKQMHDELVSLVDEMLELHKQLNKAAFASEKEPIERQIAATDKKIDHLVYQLYGLTEEEIKIVEGM